MYHLLSVVVFDILFCCNIDSLLFFRTVWRLLLDQGVYLITSNNIVLWPAGWWSLKRHVLQCTLFKHGISELRWYRGYIPHLPRWSLWAQTPVWDLNFDVWPLTNRVVTHSYQKRKMAPERAGLQMWMKRSYAPIKAARPLCSPGSCKSIQCEEAQWPEGKM